MRTLFKFSLAIFFVAGLLGLARPAAADPISVQVRSIAAKKSGKHFDGRLRDLRAKLQTAFAGYSNFTQVGRASFGLKQGSAKKISLPDGNTLSVAYHGLAGKFIKLALGIAGKLHTTLRASPGSTFFQAGLSYKGGILILAITVTR